jgi:hypothetical protein
VSRLLAEPESLHVWTRDGVPARVRIAQRERAVKRVFARWRVDADWWRSRIDREYWKVDLGGGVVCEIFQDRLSEAWWLSRVYD